MMRARRHVVAIPAHNEADHIAGCLDALAGQADRVLVLVNNTTDQTVAVARATAQARRLDVVVCERTIPAAQASAGRARRLAMAEAAALLRPGDVLFTTDADTRVAPDWIDACLRHIAAGCDAVTGRAVIDAADGAALPARLRDDDEREVGYARLLDRLKSALDPDPADPWPRHVEEPGASICVTRDALHRVGGVPDIPMGEDRALIAALRGIDARIRHAPEVWVTVSGRLQGRARGGMADTMRRRMIAPDLFLDDALEPAQDAARRARLRARARAVWQGRPDAGLARDLRLPDDVCGRCLQSDYFGAAWAQIEALSLPRRRVAAAEAAAQAEEAGRLLAALTPARDRDPCDTSQRAGARSA